MTVTAPLLWLDGSWTSSAEAGAPLLGHAAQRGSLVFDVGAFHATAHGPALFRVQDHVARFLRSVAIVGLDVAPDPQVLVQAAVEVVRRSGLAEGLVRWSAFLATREPDLLPESTKARVMVAAQGYSTPWVAGVPMRVAVFDDARKAAPDAMPPQAKVAAAYLGPMIAKRRAFAAGAGEVVLLDHEGFVAEAPTANVFAVSGGALWTPPTTRVLSGITRASVIAIAADEGIPVREEPLPRAALEGADEAFLTSTSLPLAPVTQVNEHAMLGGAPGPITARVLGRLVAARLGSDRRSDAWLTRTRA